MSDDIDTAARYRQRAKGLRSIASDETTREIRNQLLTIAKDYERLAAMLEDIELRISLRNNGDAEHKRLRKSLHAHIANDHKRIVPGGNRTTHEPFPC
jgi:hypothetical protein